MQEIRAFAVIQAYVDMTVTKAMVQLVTQNAMHVCFLTDSMSILKQVQTGCVQ